MGGILFKNNINCKKQLKKRGVYKKTISLQKINCSINPKN
jgi:hypothetical protein